MIQQSHSWVYIQRDWNQYLESISAHPVHCIFTHSSQDMKTIQVSVSSWMYKEDVVYLYNRILYGHAAAAAAKSLHSCPTLCDPRDGSLPGSPVLGILPARTLECVAISFSNAWKWKVKGKLLSRVRLLATPWTAAYQAPPSMGFSRQSTGVGCHCLLA